MEKVKNSLEIKKNYVFACAISFVFLLSAKITFHC